MFKVSYQIQQDQSRRVWLRQAIYSSDCWEPFFCQCGDPLERSCVIGMIKVISKKIFTNSYLGYNFNIEETREETSYIIKY